MLTPGGSREKKRIVTDRKVQTSAEAPRMPRARILGVGHQIPGEVVLNGPIAERLGIDDAWIVKRTGVRSRRRAAPDERLSDLAASAAGKALVDAGVSAADV